MLFRCNKPPILRIVAPQAQGQIGSGQVARLMLSKTAFFPSFRIFWRLITA